MNDPEDSWGEGEGRARWFDHASETDDVVAINVMDHAIQVNNRGSPRLFVHGPVM